MNQPDDWLDEERERHGPVTEEEIHRGLLGGALQS